MNMIVEQVFVELHLENGETLSKGLVRISQGAREKFNTDVVEVTNAIRHTENHYTVFLDVKHVV